MKPTPIKKVCDKKGCGAVASLAYPEFKLKTKEGCPTHGGCAIVKMDVYICPEHTDAFEEDFLTGKEKIQLTKIFTRHDLPEPDLTTAEVTWIYID